MKFFKRTRQTATPEPVPEYVPYSAIRPHLQAMVSDRPVIGLGRRVAGSGRIDAPTPAEPVSVDLATEGPHLLFCAASGTGASVFFSGIIAQALRASTPVHVLDAQRPAEYRHFHDHPHLRRTDTVEEIHAELLSLAGELDRRIARLADDQSAHDPLLIVVPHLPTTLDMLNDYWARTRSLGSSYRSPAISALKRILSGGRAARAHVAASVTGPPPGAPALREQFGVRVFGCAPRQAVHQAVRVLAPELSPEIGQQICAAFKRPGHLHVVQSSGVYELQAAHWLPGDLRSWSGTPATAS